MDDSDFLYGTRSGIQKAIRRGDLDLARTCFDTLWADAKQRTWLKWRMTVLVEEDAWQMIGELAQFLKEKHDDEEKAWRRFTYQLVLAPKSKDTEALMYLALRTPAHRDEHPELKAMRQCFRVTADPSEAGMALMNRWETDGTLAKLSKYEREAVILLRQRLNLGGMLGDRQACLACMLLITQRGLDERQIKAATDKGLQKWVKEHNKRKPRLVNLPWYIFDMHTMVGKMALSIFMKRKAAKYEGLDREKFADIWFLLESGQVEVGKFKTCSYSLDQKLTPFDNFWWPLFEERTLPFGRYTATDVRLLWNRELRDEIRNLVNWCLDKRSS